jgi:hypothetical protein
MVPSVDWFIYAFVRKEAVVSSQIEGTQATLIDLLAFEAEEHASPPGADVEEICNYLDALAYARGELAGPTGLPLSMRLLNETHRRLMRGVRGSDKQPGETRRTQNWIRGSRPGNAVFVPPPPHALGAGRRRPSPRARACRNIRRGRTAVRAVAAPSDRVGGLRHQAARSEQADGRARGGYSQQGRVLVEITGKKRDRSWAYQSYLNRLRVGTDLDLPPRR